MSNSLPLCMSVFANGAPDLGESAELFVLSCLSGNHFCPERGYYSLNQPSVRKPFLNCMVYEM